MTGSSAPRRPIPVIIDTDIGEDIDDILVLAFALSCPQFEVLAVTTVDGDTVARGRIARRVCAAYGRPSVPVVAGYPRSMPDANEPVPALQSVTQNAVAPTEQGLPPACDVPADELIARLAADRPGEVYLLTIGSMTNAGQALVRFPATATNLAAIVSNGGNFGPGRPNRIGWNLRYDPVAAAVVARSRAQWVLLSEGLGIPGLSHADVDRLATQGLETTDVLHLAILQWRENKRECNDQSTPHLSDLNTLAYLMGGWIETSPGRADLVVGPRGTVAELRVAYDADGPHELSRQLRPDRRDDLHDLFMEHILAEPIARKETPT